MKKLLIGAACALCALTAAACGTAPADNSLAAIVGEWQTATVRKHVTSNFTLFAEEDEMTAISSLFKDARFSEIASGNTEDFGSAAVVTVSGSLAGATICVNADGSVSMAVSGEKAQAFYAAPAGSVDYGALCEYLPY